ncbi:hypothetical protein D3C86_1427930 [compost metagenome]
MIIIDRHTSVQAHISPPFFTIGIRRIEVQLLVVQLQVYGRDARSASAPNIIFLTAVVLQAILRIHTPLFIEMVMGFQLSQIMLHNLSWCIYGIIKAAIIKGPAIGNACFQIGRITDM